MGLPQPSEGNDERESADRKKSAKANRGIVALAPGSIVEIHTGSTT
jgi:hypothetical protein